MGAGDIHDAQADRKGVEAPGILITSIDRVKQTFANQKVACLGALREQNAEFVAAEAPDDIRVPKALLQKPGDLLEGVIAFAMAKVVIDIFQIIYVDENQCRAHALARSQFQALLRQADEAAAIVQAGQFVHKGEAAQMQLGLLPGNRK